MDLEIILLDQNYVGISSSAEKSFDILAINLSVLLHYFDILMSPTKLFSNLYLAKFLDT